MKIVDRIAVGFALAACVTAALPVKVQAATPRLRNLVVIGDSLLAGFGSGGFVERGRPGQRDSAAAFVARRARVRLAMPTMDAPGLPPQLRIRDANRNGELEPGELVRPASHVGFRDTPGQRAHNLAVPGETITTLFEEVSPRSIATHLIDGDRVDGRALLKFLILGLPLRDGGVSQLTRARELAPTFVLVWIGANDVLGMALRTNPDAAELTPAQFGDRFRRLLGALADTGAGMAVANLPDVSAVAALRRAAGEVTSCREVDGRLAAVSPDDLLPLDLDRSRLPVPPCSDVLSAAERARVRSTIDAFNAEIAAAIADVEARRGVAIAPVDVHGLVDGAMTAGVDLDGDGSPDVTTRYLGGMFSLDGIHPSRTGHALVANAFIDAINARFATAIPRVNVARVARRDALVRSRFQPRGEAPFGLLAPESLDDYFERVYERVADASEEVRDDLVDELKRARFDL